MYRWINSHLSFLIITGFLGSLQRMTMEDIDIFAFIYFSVYHYRLLSSKLISLHHIKVKIIPNYVQLFLLTGVNFLDFFGEKVVMVCGINLFDFFGKWWKLVKNNPLTPKMSDWIVETIKRNYWCNWNGPDSVSVNTIHSKTCHTWTSHCSPTSGHVRQGINGHLVHMTSLWNVFYCQEP